MAIASPSFPEVYKVGVNIGKRKDSPGYPIVAYIDNDTDWKVAEDYIQSFFKPVIEVSAISRIVIDD